MIPKNQTLPFMILAALVALPCSLLAQDTWKPTFGVGIGGVHVEDIDAGSVAAKAELQVGDRITRWNGNAVVDIASLREWLASVDEGSSCQVEVWRASEDEGGRTLRELKFQFADSFGEGGSASLGVTPSYGVCVTTIQPDSVAASCGLKPGDVIVSWNGQDTDSFAALKNYVSQCRPGSKIRLGIIRGGAQNTLNAGFPGGEKEELKTTPSKNEESSRRITRRPALSLPSGDGGGGLTVIGELGEVAEDLAQTIKRLKAAEARGEAWRDAMSSLDSINERISKMAESTKGMNRIFGGFPNGEDPFGGAGASGGVFEEGSMELPETPFMKEIEERLHELLGQGVDPEEISEIISNEFPGVHVEIRSGGTEEPEEEEETIEEEAKKRADAKRRGVMAELRRGLSENRDRLEDLQERLKDLRARVKESEGEEQAEIKKSIKEVRTTSKSIRQKLEELTKKLTEMKKK